jgi:hypothetical protein
MSDMIRCNEGNTDFKDGNLIHWAKFNMMGRFVDTTAQCQLQCSISNDYDFPERPELAELLTRRPVMDPEVCFLPCLRQITFDMLYSSRSNVWRWTRTTRKMAKNPEFAKSYFGAKYIFAHSTHTDTLLPAMQLQSSLINIVFAFAFVNISDYYPLPICKSFI